MKSSKTRNPSMIHHRHPPKLDSRIMNVSILLFTLILPETKAWMHTYAFTAYSRNLVSSHFNIRLLAKTADADDADEAAARVIYSRPALYDLAFGYRPFEDEVEFLLQQHNQATGSKPRSILELAAGPARHALLSLDRVDNVTCIDSSPEMKKYAQDIQQEYGVTEGFTYLTADMRSFSLQHHSFDAAWILLGSLQHMTTNQDVIDCFGSIHRHLSPKGTLILELPHPSEIFAMVECTRNGWEVPLEGDDGQEAGKLTIVWGDEDDEFDPITQVRQFSVAMQLEGVKEPQSIQETVPLRIFTLQEIDALARCSGFSVVKMFGALNEEVTLDDEEEAFRMVCVLQKQ